MLRSKYTHKSFYRKDLLPFKLKICEKCGLRLFLYYSCLSSYTILLIWAVHGLTYIVVYLSLDEYVSHNVHKRLRTRGQIMNYIVLLGASAIIGSSSGGFISNIIGLKNTFLLCTIFCTITLIGFIFVTMIFLGFKEKSKIEKIK